MHLNNPFPVSMVNEIEKAVRTLRSFTAHKKQQIDEAIIPHSILQRAQGIVVLSIVKAGFIFTGRIGSGLVVARCSHSSTGWSAPSALGTASIGFGAQVGGELVEIVMLLNTREAVDTFTREGNVTLGTNISIALGPTGRDAELYGTVKDKQILPIFSYSKAKGLFGGVSIEGTILIERRDANAKFYGKSVRASNLLSGTEPCPEQAKPLYEILNSFMGQDGSSGSYSSVPPSVPPRDDRGGLTVTAMYDYEARKLDEISFKKGDRITVLNKTSSHNDWWMGRINGKDGLFPANYTFQS